MAQLDHGLIENIGISSSHKIWIVKGEINNTHFKDLSSYGYISRVVSVQIWYQRF